jgi:hypothetical protein
MSAVLITIDGGVGGPISGIAAAGNGGAAGTASITTGITARALAGTRATGTVAGAKNTGTMRGRIAGIRIIPIIRIVGPILIMQIVQIIGIIQFLGPTIQMEVIRIKRVIEIETRVSRGSCP